MKVCYFGIYNKDYSRNRVLMKGFRANGVDIVECHSARKGIIKYFDLVWKYLRLKKDFDLVLVAFPGQQAMILARLLTGKKIVFDAFTSLYDSNVLDRKMTPKSSLKAKWYWFADWLSCRMADKVLLDTNAHIDYFVSEFNLNKNKFIRVLIGADDSLFHK